jgi:eukaryotic-like serine/threonine-protein kinase
VLISSPTGQAVYVTDTSDTTDPSPPSGIEPERPRLYEDRYELAGPLGHGGMCTVYRAWDTRLHRHVAIKRLEPPLSLDPHARARFHHEGKAIARLSHPNLVTLIERGSTEDEEYLVFECVEGRSLKEMIKETGPMEPVEAGQIIGQVAEGLAHAHAAGIIHRDVKPQNILLDQEGRAKLTDFGIALGMDWTRLTREGSILGSTRYMSPEQVQGRPVDQRSDIYSLGIVFYEMLAGRPPFDGVTVTDIGRQHLRTPPQPLTDERPDLPPGLDRIVQRCLEKLPEARFQSMEEFLGALTGIDLYTLEAGGGGLMESLRRVGRIWDDALATSPSLAVIPEDEPSPAARRSELMERRRNAARRRRNRVVFLAGAVLVLAAVALAVVFAGRSSIAPDVVGKTIEQATPLVQGAGLQLATAATVPDETKAPGTILSQEPQAGTHPEDRTVRVTVARAPIPVKVTSVKDDDPEGNKKENPDLVELVIDGKEGTAWTTESYETAALGGIKPGVGVAFQLAEAATIVEVVSPDQGWKGELQEVGADGTYVRAADLKGVHRQTITLQRPAKAGRVWITALAEAPDGLFWGRIAEIRFWR